jgi:hypothetical protein
LAEIGLIWLIQTLPMQITLPLNPTEQLSRVRLPLVPGEQPQAGLDDFARGPETGCRHRLGKELVVDLDVGPHRATPLMCKLLTKIAHTGLSAQAVARAPYRFSP